MLKSFTKLRRHQAGDTLIEVVIATIIIGTILFTAYQLGSRAFALGQSARERSQAAQIIQSQAEGLRALRDGLGWVTFSSRVPAQNQTFHLNQGSGTWRFEGGADWDPALGDTSLPAGLYQLSVEPTNPQGANPRTFTISVKWVPFGGGPEETSTLYLHLSNPQPL